MKDIEKKAVVNSNHCLKDYSECYHHHHHENGSNLFLTYMVI